MPNRFPVDERSGERPFAQEEGPWIERQNWAPPTDETTSQPLQQLFPAVDNLPPPIVRIEPGSNGAIVELSGWLGPLSDDNALLFRETQNDTSFVSHRGGFGLTTIGVVTGFRIGPGGLFSLQPRFGWHFLHGPLQPDLPPQLYDLALEANFAKQINPVWSLHLQVAPVLATDFDNKDSDAFRLVTGGLMAAQLTPSCKIVGGLTYLDRRDLRIVPVAGVRLQFSELAVDVLIPRPRVAYRYHVSQDGTANWLYAGGDLAAGSWAYEQQDTGRHDIVGYRDFRFVIGHESRESDGITNFLEAGYVFGRRLEFERTAPDLAPGDSWGIRIGIVF